MTALSNVTSADPTDVIDESLGRTRRDLERRLVRKLDLRMCIVVVLNALNYVDRANISARLGGFEEDLHLKGQQYATVLSIVYVGYILMQLPSNMYLHWLERPAILIPSSMAIWGVVSALTGITKNYTGILLARLFLGFLEAPFYPGIMLLISGWYKRDELAVRTTLVTCGGVLSSSFGPLWLFYIEGGATVLAAISAFFILPDFPHNTRWLTPEERALAISRLAEDGYGRVDVLEKRTTLQGLQDALSDWKVWWFAAALIVQDVAFSFVIYFPTIAATLGYDTTVTLLLSAPPGVLATITSFAISRYSDKTRKRYIYIFASCATVALGFIISICTMNMAARYISMFLMTQIAVGQVVIWGWINNTFSREPAKRAAALAVISGMAQTGNILGSFVWPPAWGPTYRYSYAVCLVTLVVSTAMFGVMHLHLRRLNQRMEKDERDAKGIKELRGPYFDQKILSHTAILDSGEVLESQNGTGRSSRRGHKRLPYRTGRPPPPVPAKEQLEQKVWDLGFSPQGSVRSVRPIT
ncbi:major facilitator superfamily domain-containing protein [Suillus ampliporus]|nr:major facilitator superfamily domain-containing protein [Suillus ampliporus]